MLELVAGVQFAVVGSARLPHLPDDFQPALAQAAQRLGVAFAAFAQGVVIGRRPGALGAALVGKKMHGVAQALVAGAAQIDFVELPGLVADRRCASVALEALRIGEKLAVVADFAE